MRPERNTTWDVSVRITPKRGLAGETKLGGGGLDVFNGTAVAGTSGTNGN